MVKNMEDLQKISKDSTDAMLKQFGAFSKAAQAIATEVTDYSKSSFEEGAAVIEKLAGAKSLEKAVEIQTEYVKSAYETFVSKAAKIGELYADVAKEAMKPVEGYWAKVTPVR